jgi:hypothetical protein
MGLKMIELMRAWGHMFKTRGDGKVDMGLRFEKPNSKPSFQT